MCSFLSYAVCSVFFEVYFLLIRGKYLYKDVTCTEYTIVFRCDTDLGRGTKKTKYCKQNPNEFVTF